MTLFESPLEEIHIVRYQKMKAEHLNTVGRSILHHKDVLSPNN